MIGGRMIRIIAATTLALAVGLATASPAIAVPPERVVAEVYDADVTVEDEFLSEACGFQVTARIAGHYRLNNSPTGRA
jgi:hypothetical protein